MVTNAMTVPVLYHATLALAVLLTNREPLEQPQQTNVCIQRYLEHRQKVLQLVRYHLGSQDIDGPLAVAAFLTITEKGNPVGRHNGVHQSNREIKQLESKVYIDSKAGYGGRASMDGSKQNGLNMY
jgi:hypothetical protein